MDGIEWVFCKSNAEKVVYKLLFFAALHKQNLIGHSSGSLETVNKDGSLHVAPQHVVSLMPPLIMRRRILGRKLGSTKTPYMSKSDVGCLISDPKTRRKVDR